jgi:hypothetical protein
MAEVIGHFTTGGRSLGVFCDGGTSAAEIVSLMRRRNRPKSSLTEFERLHNLLSELIYKRGIVQYFRADSNSEPVIVSDDNESFELVPMGPKPDILRESARRAVIEGRILDDLNRTSIILALGMKGKTRSLQALLAADTDGENLNRSLQKMRLRLKTENLCFDMVKVPHHGSFDSHRNSEICSCLDARRNPVAAISTGIEFDVLPDREVLRDYLANGWTVLLTTKRVGRLRSNLALEIAGKGVRDWEEQSQTVCVKWSETAGITWGPVEAQVLTEELENYQTAKK